MLRELGARVQIPPVAFFFFYSFAVFILLFFILAESSLELVPKEIRKHSQIRKACVKKGIKPEKEILDASYHYNAIKELCFAEKRGRPDIVHVCLLFLQDSLVNREGKLRVFIHTLNNRVIHVKPDVRIPKHFDRFIGLMRQLLRVGRVPLKGEPLLFVEEKSIRDLIRDLKPEATIGFSTEGRVITDLISFFKGFGANKDLAAVVGGFPHGEFSPETVNVFDDTISVSRYSLNAWTVASTILNCYYYALIV